MRYLTFIVAMITALSISSCKLTKSIDKTKETTLDHRDSTSYTKEVVLDTIVIKERQDSLNISIEDLKKIGEIKRSSKGVQTHIKYMNDSITATCICDEISQLVKSTIEREFQSLKRNQEVIQQESTKEVVIERDWTTILILSGLLIFFVLFIILKTKLW